MDRPQVRFAQRLHGFSLVELLIVLALLGILLALAFAGPPRDRVAVNQAAERIARDLQSLRLEAVRRNEFVGLALDTATNSYLVYVDMNRDGSYTEADDTVIRQATFGDHGVALAGENVTLSLDPRGLNPNPYAGELPIRVVNAAGTYGRTVCLRAQGTTRVLTDDGCG